ncbi:MAG: response regulator [Candidatus Omnitrophota bacterium]
MSDHPVKVLIVEDEEGLAQAMAGLLKVRGLDAFYTVDGVDAVKLFEERLPELCVIDVRLGFSKLDGLEVLEKIKKIDPSVECIMVTRITEKESIAKATALGAGHYLLKPLDSREWRDVVMGIAGRIRERRDSGESVQ